MIISRFYANPANAISASVILAEVERQRYMSTWLRMTITVNLNTV